MLDPFSLPAHVPQPAVIVRIADMLSLPALPLHAHEVCFALGFYTLISQVLSPFITARLFPRIYSKFNHYTRINWHIHVVSLIQSCVVNALSFYIIFFDAERKAWMGAGNWEKRIWGYDGFTGLTQSIALGYFLWDFYISLRYAHIFGWSMVAHASATCAMFILGFRPFVYFYCPVFLLHELSSPFLNIHWFCDKLELTGSIYQAINGALLTITFFFCRLVWGTYGSIHVFNDVYHAITAGYTTPQYFHDDIAKSLNSSDVSDPVAQTTVFMTVRYLPFWLGASYLTSNVVLTLLNFFWFFKMIQTIRKRFEPPFGTKGNGDDKPDYDPSEPSGIDQKKLN